MSDYILNRADGGELRLSKLSPSLILKFRDAFRHWRKSQLVESLALVGAGQVEALKILNQFDAKRLPMEAVYEWANEPEGQATAILMSLRVNKPDAGNAELDALGLTEGEMLHAAAGVLGMSVVTKPATESEPTGGDPVPTTAASGETVTGGETQT